MKRYSCMSSLNKICSNGYNNTSKQNYEVDGEENYSQCRSGQYPACNNRQVPDRQPVLDEQTWNFISALREQACRFIHSDAEETSASESVFHDQTCPNDSSDASAMVFLKDLLNYEPQSEFLRKIKQQYLQQLQHLQNLSDSCNNSNQSQHVCEDCYGKSSVISRFKEHQDLSRSRQRSVESRMYENSCNVCSNKPLQSPAKNVFTNSRAGTECYTLEGLQPLKDDNNYGSSQRNNKKTGRQSGSVGKPKKEKVKSQHVSRSKKPTRFRSRKKRKSKEPVKCESQERFEPTLKRPHEDSCERCWRFASPSRSPVNKPDQRFDPNFRKVHSSSDIGACGTDYEIVENVEKNVSPCQNFQLENVSRPEESCPHVQQRQECHQYSRQSEQQVSAQQSAQYQNTPRTYLSEQPVSENVAKNRNYMGERPPPRTADQAVNISRMGDTNNIQTNGNKSGGVFYSGSTRKPRPQSYTSGVSNANRRNFEEFLDGLNTTEYPNICVASRSSNPETTNSSILMERNSRYIPVTGKNPELSKISELPKSVLNINPVPKTLLVEGNTCLKTPGSCVGFNQDSVWESAMYSEVVPTNCSRAYPHRPATPLSRSGQCNGVEYSLHNRNLPSGGTSPRIVIVPPANKTNSQAAESRVHDSSLFRNSGFTPAYSSTPNKSLLTGSPHIKECACSAEIRQTSIPKNFQNSEKEQVFCCHCSKNPRAKNQINVNRKINFNEIDERTHIKPSFEVFDRTFPPASYDLSEDFLPTSSYDTSNGSCLRPPSQPYQVPCFGMSQNPIRNEFNYSLQSCMHGAHFGSETPQYGQAVQEKVSPCPYRQYNNDKFSERSHIRNTPEKNETCSTTAPRNLPRNHSSSVLVNGYGPVKYSVFYMTKNTENKDNEIEVLVEELTQRSSDKMDLKTKELTDKMKRVLECHSDSMALRFQKGVLESSKSPKSDRILYF